VKNVSQDRKGFISGRKGTLVATAIIAALLLLGWVIHVRQALLMIFTPFLLSLILAYLLSPLVEIIERHKLPRPAAILVVYLVFSIIALVFSVRVMPIFLADLQDLIQRLPDYAFKLQQILIHLQEDYRRFDLPDYVLDLIDHNIQGLEEQLTAQLERSYNFLIGLFGRVLLLLLVPVLTYYFLRDEQSLKNSLLALFPRRSRRRLVSMAGEIDAALGAYIRGALLVSLAVWLLTYIGLLALGMNHPLVLSIIVGITNLIPYIGPIIGALPALMISILEQPLLSLKVLILMVVVQQVEAQLITPYIIGKSVRLHPLAVILILLAAGKLFGIAGLILALPVVIILRIICKHMLLAVKKQ